MKSFREENPNNARVYVNYNSKKVKFDYVTKDSTYKIASNLFYSLYIKKFIGLFFVTLGFGFLVILTGFENYYRNLPVLFAYFVTALFYSHYLCAYIFIQFPSLVKKLPELNVYAFARFYEGKFTKEDIKQDGQEIYCEIPLFKNTSLIYEAEEEMSEYLERVEIEEHPFDLVNLISKRRERQGYLWRARFYFSKIPQNGQIIFKFS